MNAEGARMSVDIGGTFTDVALAQGEALVTAKLLTTPEAPEQAVLEGVARVVAEAGLSAADVGLLIHGTTLATNALIERKGARTALLVTEGFRDSLEMAYEHRFEQYDINIDKPAPLVPRHLRWPVGERLRADGRIVRPLDEESVTALLPALRRHGIESVAVGLLHSYANPAHERRVGEILRAALPELAVTLSSEVCPEIREYERLSTTCANAYVQPVMARYLRALAAALSERGYRCPFFLMTSGGGLTTLDTAIRFPIRLVESGPAGGAILASRIAEAGGVTRALSFDMGGTTAKLCLIDDATPLGSRHFEVARVYRFQKGSGLPLRIPAIEMVEIGAGGGSIARSDALGRIQVGPDSAGADPGPACYDRGGTAPTVTDADVVLGRIAAEGFAGGSLSLAPARAETALAEAVGGPQDLSAQHAAYAVTELVDKNMANAARVHAIEWGKEVAERTMIAFGGAAPLHAARLAEKLGIARIVVPPGAGVGSALGFLCAPIAFEVVLSRYQRLSSFDADAVNAVFAEMAAEAHGIVARAVPESEIVETRTAFMRYLGQGHEITVSLPVRPYHDGDGNRILEAFEAAYRGLYGRTIPHLDVEVLSWTLTLSGPRPPAPGPTLPPGRGAAPAPLDERALFDTGRAETMTAPAYRRDDLAPGVEVTGPALVVEAQTTTVISPSFSATVDNRGNLLLTRVQGGDK